LNRKVHAFPFWVKATYLMIFQLSCRVDPDQAKHHDTGDSNQVVFQTWISTY
jgi:hypothetical protein